MRKNSPGCLPPPPAPGFFFFFFFFFFCWRSVQQAPTPVRLLCSGLLVLPLQEIGLRAEVGPQLAEGFLVVLVEGLQLRRSDADPLQRIHMGRGTHHFFKVPSLLLLDQSVGRAFPTGPRRPPDPVDILLDVERDVVGYDRVYQLEVNSSGDEVRADQTFAARKEERKKQMGDETASINEFVAAPRELRSADG
ncbi:MAG: hypothetical protein BJ554DRAFT_4145 [Olpidium bornovanus]|uniref:Uncharacterized protein n=1 Tax=Olpidium bornovanus TaxID=278681 RepID=A0A8H7ZN72_9FUNG|nr:MAG: hypothetical protein BJ554DRAFT_4145 [Olpidium bornovanus]